jgi:hypothetical protein
VSRHFLRRSVLQTYLGDVLTLLLFPVHKESNACLCVRQYLLWYFSVEASRPSLSMLILVSQLGLGQSIEAATAGLARTLYFDTSPGILVSSQRPACHHQLYLDSQ